MSEDKSSIFISPDEIIKQQRAQAATIVPKGKTPHTEGQGLTPVTESDLGPINKHFGGDKWGWEKSTIGFTPKKSKKKK